MSFCCCSLIGSEYCEQCRLNKGEFTYISAEPIINYDKSTLNYDLEKMLKKIQGDNNARL